jgi:phage baseplate assembly protein W|tara:strand:+ start:513 stop:911 length:399 start_codon:yes stop_codon:yes gene_type:complete
MSGLSPKLPLSKNTEDGYASNKTMREVAKQNLKMLVLTAPGERMMVPEFGVGIRNFLFESLSQTTFSKIESEIRLQADRYLPYINIKSVNFGSGNDPTQLSMNRQFDSNAISIQINYIFAITGGGDTLSVVI